MSAHQSTPRSLSTSWIAASVLLASVACSRQREPAHPVHPDPSERGTAYVDAADPHPPLIDVPLLAIRVSDPSGKRPARISAQHIAASVAFANDVYRPAGVRFRFDPREIVLLHDRRINDLAGNEQPDWAEAKRAADDLAERYPDRLVVFFRHGPGAFATGGGFSSTDFNFVVMPGWLDDSHCGHEHISALAHELGHHLGLQHTFARVFEQPNDAAAYLTKQGGDVLAFDGDGLLDTAPDPGIRSTECLDLEEIELGGVSVPLARRNVMSYYDQPDSLSAEQIQRLRWFLLQRRAYHMKLPKNRPPAALEAERLEVTSQSGGRCWQQGMDGFGAGNWSEGSQLFCRSSGAQQVVRLQLPVERAGSQRLLLYLTRAPDYGNVEVYLDAQPLGSYDAWAPGVLASGALDFGARLLPAGNHELLLVVRAKNPASSGLHLGIDAIALVPLTPLS